MSAEHQEGYKDPSILLQAELHKRHPDWVNEHALEFREKFLLEYPEILEKFMENPEEAVHIVEQKYYH